MEYPVKLNDDRVVIHHGDCRDVLAELPGASVHTVVTSPPYYSQRDYGVDGQMGLEETPDDYITSMVTLFREVRRVLRTDGTCWINMGDSYAGSRCNSGNSLENTNAMQQTSVHSMACGPTPVPHGLKPKDLIGIPWRLALALQADGWWLRQDIIWHKPNPMPESVTDRCTKAHEYIFLMTKAARYYYDADAIKEPAQDWGTRERKEGSAFVNGTPGRRRQWGGENANHALTGRNRRSVWTCSTAPYKGAHFATFPPKLIEPCVKAGCPEGGTVLDPFMGSGTTGEVAINNSCRFIGIELNQDYIKLAVNRLKQSTLF